MFLRTAFLLLISYCSFFPQISTDLNGYMQNMQTVWAPKKEQPLILSNSITNRLNFNFFYSSLTLRAGLRNILDYGQFVSLVPNYNEFAVIDNGFFNLTKRVASGNSYIYYVNIDRLNFTYTYKDFEVQLGRQRINWGINTVWTPNDIFNSASFINFDYAEKPGSDALRIQYYLDYASSIELVSKLDFQDRATIAGKFQINFWDYDFQFISGFSHTDLIFGGGWSGSISGAGFSGELTYFNNRSNKLDSKDIFAGSIGSNYMFSNSLFIGFEFLFNSIGRTGKYSGSIDIFNLEYSAKNLSPSKYSFFSQLQYPITPLLNATIATIVNPTDGSLLLNPSAEFSLNEDVFLLGTCQFFIGEDRTEWGEFGQFYYLRLKWNF